MANKVVIDTEINANSAERSIDKITVSLKNVAKVAAQTTNRIAGIAVGTAMMGGGAAISGIRKLKTAFSGLFSSTSKVEGSVKSGFLTLLKYGIGLKSIEMLFSRIRSVVKDSINTLAQLNAGNNDVNHALSNMTSSLTALKNSFGAAFAPILTAVEPALTVLIDRMTDAMNVVGQFVAALTGASTFTKAVRVQKDYAAALNATAKSAKNAKGQLAKFDEINIVSQKDNAGPGAGADIDSMFETVQIDSKIAQIADKVKSIFGAIKEEGKEWLGSFNFSPLTDSLGKVVNAAKPVVDILGGGLKWAFDNVLDPMAHWSIEDALPAFFTTTAKAGDAFGKVLNGLKPTFSYLWDEFLQPIGKWSADTFIGFIGKMGEAFDKVGDIFEERGSDIKDIVAAVGTFVKAQWNGTVKPVLDFAIGFLGTLVDTAGNIISHLIQTIHGITEFLAGAFTGDWRRAWDGLIEIGKGFLNLLIDIYEGAVNAIIGGLNKLSIDIPDGIPVLGGKHIGFNLQEMHLPRLASGTVIPRQASEFMAILGDNNREAEVVSPVSTIKQAVMDAMRDMNGSGNINITLELDGETVYRTVVNRNNQHFDRTGMSELAY